MRRLALTVSACLLVLAGCGEAGSETSSTTSPPATSTTTLAATTTSMGDMGDDMTDDSMTDHSMDDDAHDDDAHDNGDHDDGAHDDDVVASGDADRVIVVAMTEFAFEPEAFSLTPGETVEFVLTNDGVIEHEFRLTTAHEVEEHIEGGHDDHHDDEPLAVTVAAGETVSWVVTIPGEVELVACLIPGHFEAGMKAPVTLEG